MIGNWLIDIRFLNGFVWCNLNFFLWLLGSVLGSVKYLYMYIMVESRLVIMKGILYLYLLSKLLNVGLKINFKLIVFFKKLKFLVWFFGVEILMV